MGRYIDLIGNVFGRLTVVQRVDNGRRRQLRWLCRCNCKNKTEKIVVGSHLKSGHTKSCGCLRIEKTIDRSTKHGHNTRRGGATKTYRSWQNMKERCNNPNHKKYKDYGKIGITVCKRWLHSFENFLKDMGEHPGSGYSLDRIKNKLGYFKENCQWATSEQQNRNKRSNRYETYRGRTRLVIEWAEEYHMSYKTLYSRLYKYGWSIEKALNTPIRL